MSQTGGTRQDKLEHWLGGKDNCNRTLLTALPDLEMSAYFITQYNDIIMLKHKINLFEHFYSLKILIKN